MAKIKMASATIESKNKAFVLDVNNHEQQGSFRNKFVVLRS